MIKFGLREIFNVNGNSVLIDVGSLNQEKANGALSSLGNVVNEVTAFKEIIDAQKSEIPHHGGTMDELGENTNEYLEEISKKIDEKILDKIESVQAMSDSILDEAHEQDRKVAYNNYLSQMNNTPTVVTSKTDVSGNKDVSGFLGAAKKFPVHDQVGAGKMPVEKIV